MDTLHEPSVVPGLHITEDGSWTLFDTTLKEHYHNQAGAYSESLHHYVLPSELSTQLTTETALHLVDPTFGLGYNSFTWLQEALTLAPPKTTLYVSACELDAHLADYWPTILRQSCYESLRKRLPGLESQLAKGLDTPRSLTSTTDVKVYLHCHHGDLKEWIPSLKVDADILFFDAFAPRKVPDLWSQAIFNEAARLLQAKQGKLLTYSTTRWIQENLRDAGFTVSETASLGRKRGGTLAKLSRKRHLENLRRV